jgi:phenylalanyl-tRNA synthetase alpha chain
MTEEQKRRIETMPLDQLVAMNLPDLGVETPADVRTVFHKVRREMEAETRDRERWSHQPPNALRNRWLARHNSILARIDEHWRKAAPKELVPIVGREFNTLKKEANNTLGVAVPGVEKEQSPSATSRTRADRAGAPDLTLPGYCRRLGSVHPITRVQREIEDIFLGLGFAIETGPEVETVYYNFDALNIPESHPSRDDWDTLYIDSQTVLRTHTSPVQLRAMEKYGAPLYIVIPGKCYRNDKPDASHSPMFHQMEGLAVDTDITFADLKGTLEFFAKKFFGETVRSSFRPSFFPFTEPSGEFYVSCSICDGQGCSVCKQSGWIEVMGCGMVHPQVLRNGGIDPDRYSGWAFGLGIERFAMMKYGIDDIQLFFQSDLRFLQQF